MGTLAEQGPERKDLLFMRLGIDRAAVVIDRRTQRVRAHILEELGAAKGSVIGDL
jgi:hypothetical protein